MLSASILLLLAQSGQSGISRDDYGVPNITAATQEQAFFLAGYASAQDRLWQMETSRRIARGRMAEAFGPSYVASDREHWTQGYTDEELRRQFNALQPRTRQALEHYVRGVNAYVDEARRRGDLPSGYKQNDLVPQPWTIEDSLSIGVLLMRQFGRFGAGELRNMAMLAYLDGQPKAKSRKLDIFDDFMWQNDPEAITTVDRKDDPVRQPPVIFQPFDRKLTEQHLAKLPKLSLFELLPGLRIAERPHQRMVAELHGAPFKAGSYAAVLDGARSARGYPLLLSGPQMGFTIPSIVYELSINAPGYRAAGITVPGLPFIAVGATPHFAWALTSGVADTDDVFAYKTPDQHTYLYGAQTQKLEVLDRTIKVKGAEDQKLQQTRTLHGPVVLRAGGHAFVRRAASWQSELSSLDCMMALGSAKTPDEIEGAMKPATVNFNFLYATSRGQVGYRYVGRVPLRAPKLDPRLPTVGARETEWRGFVPWDKMPHVRNPKARALMNWNNKPAAWWPNGDTPVWGRVFRASELQRALDSDLPRTVSTIARRDETYPYFRQFFPSVPGSGPLAEAGRHLRRFDGFNNEGSVPAGVYQRWMDALRAEIFSSTTGTFVSPELFRLAAQPSVMLAALQRRTRFDYLQGRRSAAVAEAALRKVAEGGNLSALGFRPGSIPVPQGQPIAHRNRGTYIQIVQVQPTGPIGKNVLPPGNAESGPHAADQVKLARAWAYKRMRGWAK